MKTYRLPLCIMYNKRTKGNAKMSQKNVFQHIARNRPPAETFSFADAVAEAYETYPDIKDKIFFIDPASGDIPHPDLAVVQELIDFFTKTEPGRDVMQPIIEKCRQHKTSYCHPNGPGGGFVFVYSGDDAMRFTNRHSHKTELQFIFDHE